MTEESENNGSPVPEKLSLDSSSDFQFKAAYIVYSDLFDKATDVETRRQLNEGMNSLRQKLIDYATFYERISQYRLENVPRYRYERTSIRTQRKQEWRKRTEKQERMKRHKK